ncbi:helix-turn-helix domain-containing protein [Amycolatopsis sp. NPDC059027]|uniref:AlbA family DNA-binding domain-containing protein n=1 Tax=Amycolatopsis sp. NPDC059027 TaxID=3346709 RepID=UPI00366C37B6
MDYARDRLDDTGEVEVRYIDFSSMILDQLHEDLRLRYADEFDQICISFRGAEPNRDYLDVFFIGDDVIEIETTLYRAVPYPIDEVRSIAEAGLVEASVTITQFFEFSEEYAWIVRGRVEDPTIKIENLWQCRSWLLESLCVTAGSSIPIDHIGDVLHSIRSRDFNSLLGRVETSWLEFKSSINLDSGKGKSQLAQKVAAFANSDQTALLVVGFETTKINGADTVVKFTPVRIESNSRDRYQQVLDHWVVPFIVGLQIEIIDAGDGLVVVVIIVPAQRGRDKPFLLLAGSEKPNYFSIVRRRGEGAVYATPREVHALLSDAQRSMRSFLE